MTPGRAPAVAGVGGDAKLSRKPQRRGAKPKPGRVLQGHRAGKPLCRQNGAGKQNVALGVLGPGRGRIEAGKIRRARHMHPGRPVSLLGRRRTGDAEENDNRRDKLEHARILPSGALGQNS